MKAINVTIRGRSALLMNRYPLADHPSGEGGPVQTIPDRETAAENAAYRLPSTGDDQGNLFIPAENLRQALVNAAAYEKGKGRSTLAKFAAAGIFVGPDCLDLNVTEYVIDTRPVVIPSTKGRIPRHRPRLDEWEVSFELEFDETLITPDQIRRIVDHCGSRVGLLDFRPAKKGPFGRFMITSWEPIADAS